MKTKHADKSNSPPPTTPRECALYRVKLSCGIGRDVIEGKSEPPEGVTPMEYAAFNLLHAVEDIAEAMKEKS